MEHSWTFLNILEHFGTFWNILEHSGTFWNILENSGKFWKILEHALQTVFNIKIFNIRKWGTSFAMVIQLLILKMFDIQHFWGQNKGWLETRRGWDLWTPCEVFSFLDFYVDQFISLPRLPRDTRCLK